MSSSLKRIPELRGISVSNIVKRMGSMDLDIDHFNVVIFFELNIGHNNVVILLKDIRVMP